MALKDTGSSPVFFEVEFRYFKKNKNENMVFNLKLIGFSYGLFYSIVYTVFIIRLYMTRFSPESQAILQDFRASWVKKDPLRSFFRLYLLIVYFVPYCVVNLWSHPVVTLILFGLYTTLPLGITAGAILAHLSVICGHMFLALIVKASKYKYPKVVFSSFADVGIEGQALINRYMGNPTRAAAKHVFGAVGGSIGGYFLCVGAGTLEQNIAQHGSFKYADETKILYQKANLPLPDLSAERLRMYHEIKRGLPINAAGEQAKDWINSFHLTGEVTKESAELKGGFNAKPSPNNASASLEKITALQARIAELEKALSDSTKK